MENEKRKQIRNETNTEAPFLLEMTSTVYVHIIDRFFHYLPLQSFILQLKVVILTH